MSLFRTLFGRPLATSEESEQRVSPIAGVPILGLDALSSASYGPEAALTILMPLAATGLVYIRGTTAILLLLLAALYFSYRQTLAAYPNGGGAYTVAKENLSKSAGLVAGASLLVDYVLNVAVAISAGVGALESAIPAFHKERFPICLLALGMITFVNLRGVRDSGVAWSAPTYAFVVSLLTVIGVGIWKTLLSGGHPVPVAMPPPLPPASESVSAWLIIRSFASGCTAMTGVEAVANGVPIFAEPKVKNAQRTLTIICGLLALLLAGVVYLAGAYHVGALSQDHPGYQSVISQIVAAVAGRGMFY